MKMETLDRPAARTRPRLQLELLGFVIVVVGFILTTLGILEIGGVFNLVLGLALAEVGCVAMFAEEGRGEARDVAEFRRQLDAL